MENNLMPQDSGNIIIYQSEDGKTHIEVRVEQDTVWLTQSQLSELYQTSKSNVSEHIKHIFEEGELDSNMVVRKFRITTQHGAIAGKTQSHEVSFYNLDMIISLGYRIRSIIATHFRRWATERLKEYIIKGFTMDDERLKQLGGGGYWKELLDRIRDIRSSERVLYRQVLDLYATAVDYDPRSAISVAFFKIVQNKLHFAAHGHTAAEVIYERADSDKPFMGLTSFRGEWPPATGLPEPQSGDGSCVSATSRETQEPSPCFAVCQIFIIFVKKIIVSKMENNLMPQDSGNIIIYQSEDGKTHIEVRVEQDTVWLTQSQLSELYQTSKSNVSEHIKHIFEEGELDSNMVVRKFRITTQHGAIAGKTQSHEVSFYNLDMIISLEAHTPARVSRRRKRRSSAGPRSTVLAAAHSTLANVPRSTASRLCRPM